MEASSSGLHNSNGAALSGESNLRGYLTPINARKSATMTTITRSDSQQRHQQHLQQNKYSQPNLSTIYTLKSSSSSSNDNNSNDRGEYTPQLYLPYSSTAYSVDEKNYRGESVPPTLISNSNRQQQKQHTKTFNNKNATIIRQRTLDNDLNQRNLNAEHQQQHKQQQQIQKHYRNATGGNGLNLMSHFKSLVNVGFSSNHLKFN